MAESQILSPLVPKENVAAQKKEVFLPTFLPKLSINKEGQIASFCKFGSANCDFISDFLGNYEETFSGISQTIV
jgi:hypothetical protein